MLPTLSDELAWDRFLARVCADCPAPKTDTCPFEGKEGDCDRVAARIQHMSDTSDLYDAGYTAAQANQPVTACPHPDGSPAATTWREGWDDGDKDLARCPVCKTPMVSKGSFGYDQRYPGGVDVDWLECPNCNHIIND